MNMETSLVLSTLLISWFCATSFIMVVNCSETTVVGNLLQSSTTAAAATPPAATTDTAAQGFINITPRRRTTSSLEVKWKVPDGYILSKSYLEARRTNADQDQVVSVVTPDLGNTTSKYEICDLMTNSKYEICMYAEVTPLEDSNNNVTSSSASSSAASSGLAWDLVECTTVSTVPLIRADSLIVLFCVIGYVLLMILIGYLCWRRAHKQKEEEQLLRAEEEESVEEDEITRENGGQSKPILLSAPPPQTSTGRPRSAIEDEDIPYITPPWEQLEKEKRQ